MERKKIVNIEKVFDYAFDNDDVWIQEESWGVVRIMFIKPHRRTCTVAKLIAKLIKFNPKLEIASAFALPDGSYYSVIVIFREKNKKSSKKTKKVTQKNKKVTR